MGRQCCFTAWACTHAEQPSVQVVEDEALRPALQAAVSENTQELMQRNIAARRVHESKQVTAGDVIMSPCGQMLAWQFQGSIYVHSRRHGWQTSAQLPAALYVHSRGVPCWSHDSEYISLWCTTLSTTGQQAHVQAHVLLFNVPACRLELLPLGNLCQGHWPVTVWAPSAPVLAVCPLEVPCAECTKAGEQHSLKGMYLVEAPGQVTAVAFPYQGRDFSFANPLWAANSLLLLSDSPIGFSIYDLTTQGHFLVSAEAVGTAAWSPDPCSEPQLLVVWRGIAHLINARGQTIGASPTSFAPRDLSQVLWGKHGVAVKDDQGLWLCDLATSSSGPVLDVRHHLDVADLHGLKLSPDHRHLCASVRLSSGADLLTELLVISTLSGHCVRLEQPEVNTRIPKYSWTKQGYSLTTCLSSYEYSTVGPHSFKVIGFVL